MQVAVWVESEVVWILPQGLTMSEVRSHQTLFVSHLPVTISHRPDRMALHYIGVCSTHTQRLTLNIFSRSFQISPVHPAPPTLGSPGWMTEKVDLSYFNKLIKTFNITFGNLSFSRKAIRFLFPAELSMCIKRTGRPWKPW